MGLGCILGGVCGPEGGVGGQDNVEHDVWVMVFCMYVR